MLAGERSKPMRTYLDFETPIRELEIKAEELRHVGRGRRRCGFR